MKKTAKQQKPGSEKSWRRGWIFPLAVLGVYLAGFLFAPETILEAAHRSGSILRQVAVPISVACVMIILLNRFLSPKQAARFLGQGAGIRGILFSSLAGIVSMGPVYAWYPLLLTLKEKGVSTFHIANFIACRSIKPVLLPVLIASFGWLYATTFLVFSLAAALLAAVVVSLAAGWEE